MTADPGMPARIRAAATRLLDWHLRWILRRWGAPDIPEVRRAMRASWMHGFTFGAYPGRQQLRVIRAEMLAAAGREPAETRTASLYGPHCQHEECPMSVCAETGRPEFACRYPGCPYCRPPGAGGG